MGCKRMKKFFNYVVFSMVLLLGGCNIENGAVQPITPLAESETLATVNGRPINKATFDMLKAEVARQSRGAAISEEKLVQELIHRELLLQEAERNKLEQKPDIADKLEFVKQSVLLQAAVKDFLDGTPVTENDAKDEYSRRIAKEKATQYKARHILLKSDVKANKIIKQLQDGADFQSLAKKHSTGPSASKGGDLGWFNPKQMVPPFAQAIAQMENGAFSMEPVKTKFGWHVILFEDSRQTEPSDFEKVKARIIAVLQQEKLVNHINSLKSGADIVIERESKAENAKEEPVAKGSDAGS